MRCCQTRKIWMLDSESSFNIQREFSAFPTDYIKKFRYGLCNQGGEENRRCVTGLGCGILHQPIKNGLFGYAKPYGFPEFASIF